MKKIILILSIITSLTVSILVNQDIISLDEHMNATSDTITHSINGGNDEDLGSMD